METPRFGRGALVSLTSASVADSDGRPTPSIIDARFHEVQLLLDAGVEDELLGRIRELQVAVVKGQVIVFNLCRPIIEKRVFDADAHHPTPSGLVAAERGQEGDVR